MIPSHRIFALIALYVCLIRTTPCQANCFPPCLTGEVCTPVTDHLSFCRRLLTTPRATTPKNDVTLKQTTSAAADNTTSMQTTLSASSNQTTMEPDDVARTTKKPRIKDVCHPDYERPPNEAHECTLFCGYGICRENGTEQRICDCDEHATGPNCLNTCCKECGTYGKCVRDMTNRLRCECHEAFDGEFCEIYDPLDPCSEDIDEVRRKQVTDCGNSTCRYGFCNSTGDDGPFCQCFPKAYGNDCGLMCCLDCGFYGVCVMDEVFGNMTCECEEDYSGEHCEIFGEFLAKKPREKNNNKKQAHPSFPFTSIHNIFRRMVSSRWPKCLCFPAI